jgi:hypothetical protein
VNLRHKKPLALFTPKYLLHHRPATSALEDFTTGRWAGRPGDRPQAWCLQLTRAAWQPCGLQAMQFLAQFALN